jgi:hypothetical protein
MPPLFSRILARVTNKEADRPRRLDGFQANGAVVLTDFRGKREARLPDADTKSYGMVDDPLAIYKPTGAKHVDAAKAMGNFTGWSYAAVNAIASEVANIQLRLYHNRRRPRGTRRPPS